MLALDIRSLPNFQLRDVSLQLPRRSYFAVEKDLLTASLILERTLLPFGQ